MEIGLCQSKDSRHGGKNYVWDLEDWAMKLDIDLLNRKETHANFSRKGIPRGKRALYNVNLLQVAQMQGPGRARMLLLQSRP